MKDWKRNSMLLQGSRFRILAQLRLLLVGKGLGFGG